MFGLKLREIVLARALPPDDPLAAGRRREGEGEGAMGASSDKLSARAVRLTTDSEIVIAPRTRQSRAEALAKETHRINGESSEGRQGSGSVDGTLAARAKLKRRLYKVLPPHIAPESWNTRYDQDGEAPIAVVQATAEEAGAETDWSLLSRAFSTNSSHDWSRATISVQPCPSAERIRPMVTEDEGGVGDSGPDDTGAVSSRDSKQPRQPTVTSFVIAGSDLMTIRSPPDDELLRWPERWVWFNRALRSKLGSIGLGETIW